MKQMQAFLFSFDWEMFSSCIFTTYNTYTFSHFDPVLLETKACNIVIVVGEM